MCLLWATSVVVVVVGRVASRAQPSVCKQPVVYKPKLQ
jgi:hypothetical protein